MKYVRVYRNGTEVGRFRAHRFDLVNETHRFWIKKAKPAIRKGIIFIGIAAAIVIVAGAAMERLEAKIYPNGAPGVIADVSASSTSEGRPAVMARIAACESHDKQFNPDGSVVRGKVDKNDIGRYQISITVHGAEAMQMGYNLFTEEGNEAYAMYLYHKAGTEPWFKTKSCWSA